MPKNTVVNKIRPAAIALSVLLVAFAQSAVVNAGESIGFQWTSTCQGGCADIGLTAGDEVTAIVEIDASTVVSNAEIFLGDVVSFSLQFGDFQLDDISAVGFGFGPGVMKKIQLMKLIKKI